MLVGIDTGSMLFLTCCAVKRDIVDNVESKCKANLIKDLANFQLD